MKAFGDRPEILGPISYATTSNQYSDEEVQEIVKTLPPAQTGYDTNAISSYELFRQKKAAGLIAPQTRFQVSLPTPFPVLWLYGSGFRKHLEPLYMKGMLQAIDNIQAAIPHSELSIQIDIAAEFGLFDGGFGGDIEWWFDGPVKDGLLERISWVANAIADDVELGVHLCYGDLGHKHFKEPEDTSILVDIFLRLQKTWKHRIDYVHLPVPVARDDAAYFAPLAALQAARGDTEVYLGLVHPDGAAGTQRRMARAREVLPTFGMATECGLGRTPPEDIESILRIMAEQSG